MDNPSECLIQSHRAPDLVVDSSCISSSHLPESVQSDLKGPHNLQDCNFELKNDTCYEKENTHTNDSASKTTSSTISTPIHSHSSSIDRKWSLDMLGDTPEQISTRLAFDLVSEYEDLVFAIGTDCVIQYLFGPDILKWVLVSKRIWEKHTTNTRRRIIVHYVHFRGYVSARVNKGKIQANVFGSNVNSPEISKRFFSFKNDALMLSPSKYDNPTSKTNEGEGLHELANEHSVPQPIQMLAFKDSEWTCNIREIYVPFDAQYFTRHIPTDLHPKCILQVKIDLKSVSILPNYLDPLFKHRRVWPLRTASVNPSDLKQVIRHLFHLVSERHFLGFHILLAGAINDYQRCDLELKNLIVKLFSMFPHFECECEQVFFHLSFAINAFDPSLLVS